MLILCASVYFHTKFGINITDKNAGIGLTMAFFTCISSLIGGFLVNKESVISFDTEGSLEPLIDLNQEREKKNLSIDRDITVGQAMDQNQEPEIRKEEAVVQTSNPELSPVQKSENQKLWGWGHNMNNSNDKR
jgi:hypothetical protein